MIAIALRLVFSLAVVVGLLLLLARFAGRRFQGKNGAVIQVVHRQQLTRGTGVAVVTVGERVLVLGTTEQNVTLLTEMEPDELQLEPALAPDLEPGFGPELGPDTESRIERGLVAARATDGALAGSVLSAETWRQALRAARGTSRDAS